MTADHVMGQNGKQGENTNLGAANASAMADAAGKEAK
jgi:hypothetical protein